MGDQQAPIGEVFYIEGQVGQWGFKRYIQIKYYYYYYLMLDRTCHWQQT